MKNKGFTLIELLGVMIILAILVTLAFPSIINVFKKTNDKIDESTQALLNNALDIYVSKNQDRFPKVIGNKYIVEIDELVSQDLISGELNLSNNIDLNNKCAQVTYDGKYHYEIKNECIYYNKQLSDPILFNDTLTPVIYNGNNWVVADKSTKWYDYENQEWANAVILKNSKNIGEVVNVEEFNSDVYAMYVWVPRYEYKISDAASSTPKEISVNFISKDTTTPSDGYTINSGFTFGSTNLSGIWVGKFETSHVTLSSSSSNNNLNCQNESCTSADNLRIVPNVQSLRYNNVSNNFFASRSMGRSGNPFGIDNTLTDSHMMKNSEWGIVAYLSQSKYGKYGNSDYTGSNKEIYINNSSSYYTGRSGGAPGGSTPINTTYTSESSTDLYNTYGFYTYDDYLLNYNTNTKGSKVTNKGTGASTTGNIYGVYDMSGGTWEHVMGVFANSNGELWSGKTSTENSGFTGKIGESGTSYTGVSFPDSKYYDVYKASSGTTMTPNQACNSGICYGHAINPEVENWYSDFKYFISSSKPWFGRGGNYYNDENSGIISSGDSGGDAYDYGSFRLVLSEA
jgi:prepilin-type N-terminal cleavage/methylation domain-containing protein